MFKLTSQSVPRGMEGTRWNETAQFLVPGDGEKTSLGVFILEKNKTKTDVLWQGISLWAQ